MRLTWRLARATWATTSCLLSRGSDILVARIDFLPRLMIMTFLNIYRSRQLGKTVGARSNMIIHCYSTRYIYSSSAIDNRHSPASQVSPHFPFHTKRAPMSCNRRTPRLAVEITMLTHLYPLSSSMYSSSSKTGKEEAQTRYLLIL